MVPWIQAQGGNVWMATAMAVNNLQFATHTKLLSQSLYEHRIEVHTINFGIWPDTQITSFHKF